MNKTNRTIVYVAMYAALFVLFDRISDMLNIFKMANGGKLNLGPIVLLLSSYHLGCKNSLSVCLVSVILQFIVGSVTWYGFVSFLLDYLLGYCCYGLASIFKNYKAFYTGVLLTSIFRLLLSTISGTVAFMTPLWASFVYNFSYILPTTICAMIMVPILCRMLKPVLEK